MVTRVQELVAKHGRRHATKVLDILRKSQNGPELIRANYRIDKVSPDDERLVTGQVYAPDSLDSHGHFMTAAELKKVAHNFLADGLLTSIDVQHDNIPVDAVIVESFIARKGDPDFEEGAWVATTKINDPAVWSMVKNGQINGYSFEILTYREDLVVEIEYKSWYFGFTDPDPHDRHTHPFIVRLDENGEIVPTMTGLGSDGSPAHPITKSNVTGAASGHTHRIHLRD
jgi:hypothetical protein